MRCGALTTPLRLQVGLDHKDADEQTFTEYCPHTFQALVFKQHPDPGEWARSPLTDRLVPRPCLSCPRAGALVCTHNSWLGACWRSELRAQLARRLLWREPVSSNGSFGG